MMRFEPALLKFVAALLTVFLLGFILLPILVTMALSFSEAASLRFPIRTWSAVWYADFLSSPQWMSALKNSLIVAAGTTLISVPIGAMAAWAFERYSIPARGGVYLLILMPLFVPGIVLGLSLAITFGTVTIFGMPVFGTRPMLMLAHALWAIPLVFMLMEASLRTLDFRLFEASADLGAGPIRTFIEIGAPALSTGLLSSTLFACVISLNEFVMALFLTTRDTQTLPVLMWLSLRSAGTPRLAVASVILVITVFASLMAIFLWYLRQLRR